MAPAMIDLTINDDEDEESPAKAAVSALKSFLPRTTKQIPREDARRKSEQSGGDGMAPVTKPFSSPAQRRSILPWSRERSGFQDNRRVERSHIGVRDDHGIPWSDNAVDEIRQMRLQSNGQAPFARTSQVDYELPSGFKDHTGIQSRQKDSQQPQTSSADRMLARGGKMFSISSVGQRNTNPPSRTITGVQGHSEHLVDAFAGSNSVSGGPVLTKDASLSAGSSASVRNTPISDDGDPIDLRPFKRPRVERPYSAQSPLSWKSAQDDVTPRAGVNAHSRPHVNGYFTLMHSPRNDQPLVLKEDRTDAKQLLAEKKTRDTIVDASNVELDATTVTKPHRPTKRLSAAARLAESLLYESEDRPMDPTAEAVSCGKELSDDPYSRNRLSYDRRQSDKRKKSLRTSEAGSMITPDSPTSDGSTKKVKLGTLTRPDSDQDSANSDMSPFLKSRNVVQQQASGHAPPSPKKLVPLKTNAPSVHGTPYTPEEDSLLIDLKEVQNVPWNQMEQYFNGRTRGSLQVRYSSKLKDRSILSTFATAKTQTIKEDSGNGSVTPVGLPPGRPQRVRRNNEAYAGDGFVSWEEIKKRRLVEELESQDQVADQPQHPTSSIPQFTTERVFPKPVSMILRQRELGTNSGRGWLPTRAVPRELEEHVYDSIGPRKFFKGTSSDVTCVAWAPNGQRFAASSIAITDDRSMQYNKPNNLLLGDFERSTLVELPEHHIQRPVVDERSNVNGLASMRQTQDSRLFMTVANVQFSPDSQTLYSVGSDCKARAYCFDNGVDKYQCMYELEHSTRVDLLSVSNHGMLATACHQSSDGSIRVYKDEMLALSLSPSRSDSQTNRAIYPSALRWGTSPRLSNFLLAGFSIDSADDERDIAGETCLWDVASERRLELHATTRNVFDVAWNPLSTSASHVFAVASTPGSSKVNKRTRSIVQCFAPKQGNAARVLELECPAFDINDVVYCPHDDNLLAVGATDGKVYVWDQRYAHNEHMALHVFEHGESLNVLDHDRNREIADTGIRFLSWGATSTRLYSGSSDGVVKIWNPYMANEYAHVKDVATFSSAVMSGSFSPDYRDLLIGEDQGRLNILSAGYDDKTVRSMQPFHYVPAPAPETESTVPESHAAAKELLDTEQIQLRHMGTLPKKQAVQGVNYRGPYLSPTSEQMVAADQELKAAQEDQYQAHLSANVAWSQGSQPDKSARAADKRVEQALEKMSALQLKADDAMILAPKALDLQRQFKKAKNERRHLKKANPNAFKRCKLDCAYTPANTDEDGVPDSHRSEDRIPVALWPSQAIDLSSATPEDIFEAGLTGKCISCFAPASKPSTKGRPVRCAKCALKASGLTSTCKNCGTPVRLLDGQAKTGLCERCSFACFRCGETAVLAEDLRHVACPRCDLVWMVGALGYEVERQSVGNEGRLGKDVKDERTQDAGDDDDDDDGEDFGEKEIEYYLSRCGT